MMIAHKGMERLTLALRKHHNFREVNGRNDIDMKHISIIGDSISTYEGANPPGYSVFYDPVMQKRNGLSSVNETWWAIVTRTMHGTICVNNSYSGSRVTGEKFPAASSIERISSLGTETLSPDIILIYIGINDYGNGVPIRHASSFFDRWKTDVSCFEDAYACMIGKIKKRYPRLKIVCGTLMRSKIRNRESWMFPERHAGVEFEAYNDVIRHTARKKKVCLADLGAENIRYETLDGTHPTVNGHATIADAWIGALAELGLM